MVKGEFPNLKSNMTRRKFTRNRRRVTGLNNKFHIASVACGLSLAEINERLKFKEKISAQTPFGNKSLSLKKAREINLLNHMSPFKSITDTNIGQGLV